MASNVTARNRSAWPGRRIPPTHRSSPQHPSSRHLHMSCVLGSRLARQPHPAAPGRPLGDGPQMMEISRDGKRVYVTNSLYAAWDDMFYPAGAGAWLAKFDADTRTGGLVADERFFPHGDEFRGLRVHQTRLQGGDASSDSYCFAR